MKICISESKLCSSM